MTSIDDMTLERTATIQAPEPNPVIAKTPPGTYGLPVLGMVLDTIDFLLVSGWEQFFRRRQRRYRSTLVFKCNLFKPTIAMLDHKAIAPLFDADDLIQDYGFSWAVPPRPLVGDVSPSVFETGVKHDAPKALYQQILRSRAPELVGVFTGVAKEFTDRWITLGRFGWRDELENFAATFLFRWILGDAPDPQDVRAVYNNIFTQKFVAITKHIPWSNYSRSVRKYNRLVEFVRSSPHFPQIMTMARQHGLTDEVVVAKQLMFVLGMNSFLGVQNLMKTIVGELSQRLQLRDAIAREMTNAFGFSCGPIDLGRLAQLPLLDKTLREILRLHAPVAFIFGRATRDRTLESTSGRFMIRKGELLMGVIPMAHRDPSVFSDPDAFKPERFDDPDASAHLIWPRGPHDGQVSPHDRTCPGKDVAILVAKLFCAVLFPHFAWRLEDRPRWEHQFFSLNVAAPKGPLTVDGFRRA